MNRYRYYSGIMDVRSTLSIKRSCLLNFINRKLASLCFIDFLVDSVTIKKPATRNKTFFRSSIYSFNFRTSYWSIKLVKFGMIFWIIYPSINSLSDSWHRHILIRIKRCFIDSLWQILSIDTSSGTWTCFFTAGDLAQVFSSLSRTCIGFL